MSAKGFDYEKRFDNLIKKTLLLKNYISLVGYGETNAEKIILLRQAYSDLLQGLFADLCDTKWIVHIDDSSEITKEEANGFLDELKGV